MTSPRAGPEPHYVTCPGCGESVQLLPPRPARNGRVAMPWRRRQHGSPLCRYPTEISADEQPADNAVPPGKAGVEPVGCKEIAARLGVRDQTVVNWRQHARREREAGRESPQLFPTPKWTVGGGPAWDWPDIEAWAVRTRRLTRPDTVPVPARSS